MRSDKKQNDSITQPLLQDLMDRSKADRKLRNPFVGTAPVEPSALYEDAGSGFNKNFVFPQD